MTVLALLGAFLVAVVLVVFGMSLFARDRDRDQRDRRGGAQRPDALGRVRRPGGYGGASRR